MRGPVRCALLGRARQCRFTGHFHADSGQFYARSFGKCEALQTQAFDGEALLQRQAIAWQVKGQEKTRPAGD